MALPTAPLGQLPNMSMPYSIPTYEVGPSIWQKALAAFLVNAAGGAAERGVSNVMSRDYAKDFGETPASGWSKLVSGPTVGEKDATMRREQAFDKEKQLRGIGAEANVAKFNAAQSMNRQAADINARADSEMLANDRAQAELDSRRGLVDAETSAQARIKLLMEQIRAENERRDPLRQAETRLADARALNEDKVGMIQRLRAMSQPQDKASGVNPNVAEFARGGGATGTARQYDLPPSATEQQSSYVSGPQDVQRLLAAGATEDDIRQAVARQQATNVRAQAMPLPTLDAASPTPGAVDPRLAALLEELGLAPKPTVYEMPGLSPDIRTLR